MIVQAILIASALSLASPAMLGVADPRAQDAADAFSQLCIALHVGETPTADPDRFDVTELGEKTRREIKPNIKASSLWDVHAKASDASMLVYYEPQGICVVEIAEADEASVLNAIGDAAERAAKKLGATPIKQEREARKVAGLITTSSVWRLPSQQGDVLIMLTTTPEPKYMIQHVVTVSLGY